MNEQGFHCIAHTRSLDLGVEADFLGHIQIGTGVHVNMAYAFKMFEYRNFGMFDHKTDQTFTATWYD